MGADFFARLAVCGLSFSTFNRKSSTQGQRLAYPVTVPMPTEWACRFHLATEAKG